jgi:hypothetical protein
MTHKSTGSADLMASGIKYVSSALTPDRLAYWMKMPEWTSDEAAALLCGIDPDGVVNSSMVVVGEAIQGGVNLGPSQITYVSEDFDFNDLRRLLERAGPSGYRAPPARWLTLAKKLDICLPPELEAAVAKYDQRPVLPPKLAGKPVQATDAEIDSWIREQDAATGVRIGKSALWKLAQEIGLCTKEKLEARAKLAERHYPARVGRPKKKLAQEIGRKI